MIDWLVEDNCSIASVNIVDFSWYSGCLISATTPTNKISCMCHQIIQIHIAIYSKIKTLNGKPRVIVSIRIRRHIIGRHKVLDYMK